ncbi:hypothetical protein ACTFIR_010686 [Dictyostelium discoideum]
MLNKIILMFIFFQILTIQIKLIQSYEIRYFVFSDSKCISTNIKIMISATKCSNFGLVQIINNNKITINNNINSINDCLSPSSSSSSKISSNSIEKELNKCYFDQSKNESYLFQLSKNEQPISIESFCTQSKQLNEDSSNTNNNNKNNNKYYMIYSHINGSCQSVGNNKFTQLYCIGDKIHEYNCIDKCKDDNDQDIILNENNNCQFVKSYLSNSTNNCNSKSVKVSKLLNNKNQLENSSSSSTFNLFLLLLEIIIIINVVNYI